MNQKRHNAAGWRIGGGVLVAAGFVLAGPAFLAAGAGGPSLGAARSFGALGGSTVTSTGASSVTGDVGVSPGTDIVGFPPATITNGAVHAGNATAAQAHADAAVAYDFLAGMASIPANLLSNTDLGGLTLTPGVYKFDAAAALTGTLTLDAQGESGALFVFQVGSAFTTSSSSALIVINGGADYDESNIFWQVGTSATFGLGTSFTGTVIAGASITFETGSTLTGNAIALTGAVTLDASTVVVPALVGPPVPSPATPTALAATPTGGIPCTGTELRWTDTSDTETEFRIYRRDGAGPAFVRVGTVNSANTAGTGALVTFQDVALDSATTYTYRVTAISFANGESIPSTEVLFDTCVAVPVPNRFLSVQLGRARSVIMDKTRARSDSVRLKGSYAVIDVTNSVPTIVHGADPRDFTLTFEVRAPGNLATYSIPAHHARWNETRPGIFRWSSNDGRNAPAWNLVMDTRRSEFTLIAKRSEFGAVPVNAITITMSTQGATGSDTSNWATPPRNTRSTRALFTNIR